MKNTMASLDRQAFNALQNKKCPGCREKMLWDSSNDLWYCPDCNTEVNQETENDKYYNE